MPLNAAASVAHGYGAHGTEDSYSRRWTTQRATTPSNLSQFSSRARNGDRDLDSSSFSIQSQNHPLDGNGLHSTHSFASTRRDLTSRSISGSKALRRNGSSSGCASPGHTTFLAKKKKLYREAQLLPLWGIRKVAINPIDRDDLSRFLDNTLRTHRFRLWTFIPLTIWEQFHRVNNLWLLCILILQGIALLTSRKGPTRVHLYIIIPFISLIIISAIKDGLEDYQRFLTDERINNQACTIVDGHAAQFKTVTWRSLRVGNILRLHDGEEVPVDIVLLATSNPDGIVFAETSSINGETHLKEKRVVKETRGEVTAQAISTLRGRIVCEEPNACLESFSGSLKLAAHPRVTALDVPSFILKGSRIRNTEWVHGVVIYTGCDTRISRHILKSPIKRIPFQKLLNQVVFFHALLVTILAIMVGIFRWRSIDRETNYTFFGGFYPPGIWWYEFVNVVVLVSPAVPNTISAVVAFARALQGISIGRDKMMTRIEPDGTRFASQARSTELNELLGQVDFILTDKTGTLTTGNMLFQCCSIAGKIYGLPEYVQRQKPFKMAGSQGRTSLDEQGNKKGRELLSDQSEQGHKIREIVYHGSVLSPSAKIAKASKHFMERETEEQLRNVSRMSLPTRRNSSFGLSWIDSGELNELTEKNCSRDLKAFPASNMENAIFGTFEGNGDSDNMIRIEDEVMTKVSHQSDIHSVSKLANRCIHPDKVVRSIPTGPIWHSHISTILRPHNQRNGTIPQSIETATDLQVCWSSLSSASSRIASSSMSLSPSMNLNEQSTDIKRSITIDLKKHLSFDKRYQYRNERVRHSSSSISSGRRSKNVSDFHVRRFKHTYSRSAVHTRSLDSEVPGRQSARQRWSSESRFPSDFRSLGPAIDSKVTFKDCRIFKDLNKGEMRGRKINEFMKAIALCNSVVPQLNLASMLYQFRSPSTPSLEPHKSHITNITNGGRARRSISQHTNTNISDSTRLVETPIDGAALPASMANENANAVATKLSSFPSTRSIPRVEPTSRLTPTQGRVRWRRSPSWDRSLLSSLKYRAAFPEEECLVAAAARMGYALVSRSVTSLNLECNGVLKRFEVFGVNDFTSERQIMSIVVKQAGHSRPTLYCKGSDAVMLNLCSQASLKEVQLPRIHRHLRRLALQGLRSLVVGRKTLTLLQAEHYRRLCNDCKGQPESLHQLSENFETELEFIGITGVKDTLFPGTSDTIQSISAAGVRVWLVTGDFQELALHVGYSSKLICPKSQLFKATLELKGQRGKREALKLYENFKNEMLNRRPDQPVSLLVTGADLANFLSSADLQTIFFSMACSCNSVLCCRVQPTTKSLLAKALRSNMFPEPIVLAVGDGINDAALLQASHIGVAIAQGSAMPFSDFCIPSIQYLKCLLFVHGRLNYLRTSSVVLWMCFKCFLTVTPVALYIITTDMSATSLYVPLLWSFYELIWIPIPGIVHAVVEDDVPPDVAIRLPVLYTLGRRHLHFSLSLCLVQAIEATIIATAAFYVAIKSFPFVTHTPVYFGEGILTFTLLVVLNKLCIMTHHYTAIFLSVVLGFGILGWFLFLFFVSSQVWSSPEIMGIAKDMFESLSFWLRTILLTSGAAICDLLCVEVLQMWTPNLSNRIRSALVKHSRLKVGGDLPPHKSKDGLTEIEQSARETNGTNLLLSPTQQKQPLTLDAILAKFDPMRHRRVAQRLPNPQRFRLKRPASQGGGYYAPLPLVADVDRLTALSQLKHRDRERFLNAQLVGPAGLLKCRNQATRRNSITRRHLTSADRSDISANEMEVELKRVENIDEDKFQKRKIDGDQFGSDVQMNRIRDQVVFNDEGQIFKDDDQSVISGMTEEFADETNSQCEQNHLNNNTQLNYRINVTVADLIDMITLRFKDQQLESDYQVRRKKTIRKFRRSYSFVALFLFLLTLLVVIYDFFYLGFSDKFVSTQFLVALLPNIAFFLLFLATLYDFFFAERFDILMGGFIVSIGLLKLLTDYLRVVDGVTTAAIFSVIVFVVSGIPFIQALIYIASYTLLFALRYVLSVSMLGNYFFRLDHSSSVQQNIGGSDQDVMSFSQLLHYLPILLGILAFSGFVGYRLEYNQRKRFLLNYQVEVSRHKQREILNTMLPEFIVDQMLSCSITKDGIPVGIKAEDRGTVSIIFCDVYEFQKIVACVEPTHLVKVLDSLFLCFDKCAEQYGCAKVETVFETYLAAAGLRFGVEGETVDSQQDAFDALDMSLAMLGISKYITYEVADDAPEEEQILNTIAKKGKTMPEADDATKASKLTSFETRRKAQRIRVKIGLHSGRVISGVVGAKKPQYALFGDAVNTASRMKTTGEPDMIHVSEATYDLLKEDDSLVWEQRQIEVKGKGLMNTFLLTNVPGTDHSSSSPGWWVPEISDTGQIDELEVGSPETTINQLDIVRTVRFESEHELQPRASSISLEHAISSSGRNSPSRTLTDVVGSQTEKLQRQKIGTTATNHMIGTTATNHLADSIVLSPASGSSTKFRVSPCHLAEAVTEGPDNSLPSAVPFGLCLSQTEPQHSPSRRQAVTFRLPGDCVRHSVQESHPAADFWEKFKPVWKRRKDGFSDSSSMSYLSSGLRRNRSSCSNPSSRPLADRFCLKVPMRWLLLTFRNREVEQRYKLHFYSNTASINTIEQALIIFLIAFVLQTLVFIMLPRFSETGLLQAKPTVTWTIRSIFTATAFLLWLLFHYRENGILSNVFGIRWLIFLLNLNFITTACTFMLSNSWGYQYRDGGRPFWLHNDTLELFFYITILHHNSGLLFQHVVLVNALLLAVAITFIIVVAKLSRMGLEALPAISIFMFANVVPAYFKEYVDRLTFVVNEEMQNIEDRGRELLHDMLPRQVLEEFQQDKLRLAYNHDHMTFLFADICGFTAWAKDVEATEVVCMLQQLFAKFDRDSTTFGLYKLCTIGDAYVAVSEPVTEANSGCQPSEGAQRVLQMAHAMIENIKAVRERLQIPQLNMRIGLHHGKCVGGVIGSGRLRYDLWGLDVLTGNLIESGGLPGKICVSGPLKIFLAESFPGTFRFEFHKKIWVINHFVDSYILSQNDQPPGGDEYTTPCQRSSGIVKCSTA